MTASFDSLDLLAKVTTKNSSGINWHAEFQYAPIEITKGIRYKLSFEVRSDFEINAWVWITQAKKPWKNVGLSLPFDFC